MKNFLLYVCVIMLNSCQSSSLVNDENVFIENLLAQMTLEEKVGQLNQRTSQWEMTGPAPKSATDLLSDLKAGKVGSMLNVVGTEATRAAQQIVVDSSRLGIPLVFGYDVIHGYQTMLPIPLGEASAWDPELSRLASSIAAQEAAASGIHWTFAPMVDVGRDARWGRVMEGSGEDPYLGSVLGVARVKGFQGDSLSSALTVAACAKHFAGYAFAEAGRDYNTVELGDETLHNIVLPPFRACANAGVATFMNAFNTVQGMPATASTYLQRDLLKKAWGFDGLVVSDWNSVGEIQKHGAAASLEESALRAITAGSDMDMEALAYSQYLVGLVESGQVEMSLVDDAVRRVLRLKYRLGLFEDPYKYCDVEREKQVVGNKDFQSLARKIGRESMVLLKNEGALLPLSKNISSLAVIGPLADDKDVALGSWRAQAIVNSAVSLLDGVKSAVGSNTNVIYAKGCDLTVGKRSFITELSFNTNDKSGFDEAVKAAKQAEVVLLAIGEDCFQSGEGRSQTDITLKGVQLELFKAVYKVNPNVVVVLMNGRPVAIPELAVEAPAMLETWFAGSQAGHAICDVLFGAYNPAGKLPVTFPRNVGQCPIYYNHKSTGRGETANPKMVFWSHYTDAPNTPLFPFGYGLSYTTFSYTDLSIEKKQISQAEHQKVTVRVTNTGKRDGEEVVQLYIQDVAATYARPVKELKGFRKIKLAVGESQLITFELGEEQLGYFFPNGEYVVEKGTFKVYVGTSSADVLETTFVLE